MPEKHFTPEQAMTILTQTPSRIEAVTASLTDAQLRSAPASGEWSANEVLAHLRACSDVWGSYMRRMLAEDQPTWKAVNPTTWIKETDYLEQEFQPSFRAFSAQRTELLAVLEHLTPEQWS